MLTHTQQKALKVQLLDISAHNQAILEFFFAGAGKQAFQVVSSQQDADIFITDFDYPDAQKKWEENYAKLEKPTLAIAIQKPEQAGCEWIPKPITSANLLSAALTVREKSAQSATTERDTANTANITTQPKQQPTKKYKAPPLTRHRSAYKSGAVKIESSFSARPKSVLSTIKGRRKTPPPLPTDNKAATLIAKNTEAGTTDKAATTAKQNVAPKKKTTLNPKISKQRVAALTSRAKGTSARYNRENYFEGSIIAALRLARQTNKVIEIKYEPRQFYILYNEYTIISSLNPTSAEYQTLCTTKVMPGQISLHILNDDESSAVKTRFYKEKSSVYHLEAFVWSTCLLSSQGRLTHRYDSKKVYLLRDWPNFTRLEQFPFAMNIAALWNHEPNTLLDIARKMDISENYVNAFFNAANGLSLFEENPEKITNKATTKPRKKAGIIARLFSRLTRGGVNAT